MHAITRSARLAALLGCGVIAAGCQSLPESQQAFYDNLSAMCGQSFEGRTVFMAEPSPDFMNARLTMHVDSCTRRELRIPFHLDDDRSRTWVITVTSRGLHLRHDHRYDDGTPHDLTDYGGYATEDGTAWRQSFAADELTAEMLPEASTNVWTLELRPDEGLFIYDLKRHNRPRYRAEFDTTTPIER